MRLRDQCLNSAARPRSLGFLTVLAAALCVAGCSPAGRSARENLADSFVPTGEVQRQEDLPVRRMEVQRRGVGKVSLVLLAPASVKASLEGYRGAWTLQLMMAPVFNVGDGIRMEMWLQDGGGSRLVCSRYVDPGRRYQDRAWIPVKIPLDISSDCAGIEIRVSGGPQGDLTGDWLAFADMHLSAGADQK